MEIEALTAVLDRSIVAVAERQFGSLSKEMTKQEWSNKVHESLNSLAGLQQSNPPDYNDPWIALFYLTWYQPGQIQLVHLLMDEQRKASGGGRLLRSDCQVLHVIDLGCGALALRFGLVLAVAAALELGDDIGEIHIDSIDPNTTMAQMGVMVWNEFLSRALSGRMDNPELKWVLSAIRRFSQPVPTLRNIKLKELNVNPEAEYWLTAIHAVYPNNVEEIKSSLAYLALTNEPDISILTGHKHTGQGTLLQRVSPFEASQFVRRVSTIYPVSSDSLPGVTHWRQIINEQMDSPHRYLDREVTWAFPRSLVWTYTRAD